MNFIDVVSEDPMMFFLKSKDILDVNTGYHLGVFHHFPPFTKLHTHDFFEFFLIVSGKLKHIYMPNRENIMGEGDLAFIFPGVKHGFERVAESDCYMINLAFSVEEMRICADYMNIDFGNVKEKQTEPRLFKISSIRKEWFVRRLENQSFHSKGSVPGFRIILAELLWQIYHQEPEFTGSEVPSWILELCSLMRKKENFTAGISRMQDLANRSPEHLSREFKKYLSDTPSGFINHLRLDYAYSRLIFTGDCIADIAYESGFNNLSYFNRLFKSKFLVSPTQVRNPKPGKTKIGLF